MSLKNKLAISAIILSSSLLSQSASATLVNTGDCDTSSVNLTGITTLDSNDNLLDSNYDATACIGTYSGDDLTTSWGTGNNIGEEGDGLLNGEYFLTGMEFIEEEDLQDIDGDGNATDPGWIHLANVVYDTGSKWWTPRDDKYTPHYDELGLTIDINSLLELSFGFDGSWQLATKENVIDDVYGILPASTFDHLAFSLNTGLQWAVYDFNFKEIFEEAANDELNFSTPYVLNGNFNMQDFWWQDQDDHKALHINVFARDPADTEVPEPESLAIFAIGLMGLALRKRKSK